MDTEEVKTSLTGTAGAVYMLRDAIVASDIPVVSRLARGTGNFTEAEVDVALEVAQDAVSRGIGSGYHFLWCTTHETDVGYCCFGPIPCTNNRFEIYWIVVEKEQQHRGIGSLLLREAELRIRAMNGSMVYLDTSLQDSYLPTRAFYEKNGYLPVARLEDFFDDGDHKAIYRKIL